LNRPATPDREYPLQFVTVDNNIKIVTASQQGQWRDTSKACRGHTITNAANYWD
jgi:hypothetical protein